MNAPIEIVPTDESYIKHFQQVVDSVARERKYLASIVGFPIEKASAFVANVLSGAGVQFFAKQGEEVIGWCDIVRHSYIGCEHVGVLGMGVVASHRRKGAGRKLLTSTVAAAFDAGFEKIELEVFSTNSGAIELYRTSGFVVEGVRKHSRKFDGLTEDIICMALFQEDGGSVT